MGMSKAEEDSNPSKGHKQEKVYLNDPNPFYLHNRDTADVPKGTQRRSCCTVTIPF